MATNEVVRMTRVSGVIFGFRVKWRATNEIVKSITPAQRIKSYLFFCVFHWTGLYLKPIVISNWKGQEHSNPNRYKNPNNQIPFTQGYIHGLRAFNHFRKNTIQNAHSPGKSNNMHHTLIPRQDSSTLSFPFVKNRTAKTAPATKYRKEAQRKKITIVSITTRELCGKSALR